MGNFENDLHVEEMIKKLGIGYGESDVFRLYKSGGFDAISSDDGKFLRIIDALDVPYLTPTALILYLLNIKVISKADSRMYINNLKDIISEEEFYLAMREVE